MDNATIEMLHGMTARVAMHATRGMGRDRLDDVRQVAYLTALEAMPALDARRKAEPFLAVAALRRCGNYLDHATAPVSGCDKHDVRKELRGVRAVPLRARKDVVQRGKGIDDVIAWSRSITGDAPGELPSEVHEADDLRERVRRAVDKALLSFPPKAAAICRRLCALDRWADGDRPSFATVAKEFGLRSHEYPRRVWGRFLRRLRADVVLRELAAD